MVSPRWLLGVREGPTPYPSVDALWYPRGGTCPSRRSAGHGVECVAVVPEHTSHRSKPWFTSSLRARHAIAPTYTTRCPPRPQDRGHHSQSWSAGSVHGIPGI